jgi:hypothetical protein
MEPVEINAGSWYLRGLRDDHRVDDRPFLVEGGIADPGYVRLRAAQWESEQHYSWAVCEPTTGALLAEIGLTPPTTGTAGGAVLGGWAREGHEDALRTGLDAVRRFAVGGLGLVVLPTPAKGSPPGA